MVIRTKARNTIENTRTLARLVSPIRGVLTIVFLSALAVFPLLQTSEINQQIVSVLSSAASNETAESSITTNERYAPCDSFFGGGDQGGINDDDHYPSASSVWHRLRNRILNASFFPEHAANAPAFRHWVEELFEFHTVSRLRKTRTHPANPNAIKKILQILQRRIGAHRDNRSNDQQRGQSQTTAAEPLHILVLGGSVTDGTNCFKNPLGLDLKKSCTWPERLEHMLNQVFFGGDPIVKVTRMTAGGSSSEIGSVIMEYHLFPKTAVPHIIVNAYAPNDVQQPNLDKVFYEETQDFIQLAQNVRPCDEDLPLVVLADHSYGFWQQTKMNLLSGWYAALASWYDVMAFNNMNVARHELIGNYENTSAIEQLVGNNFEIHLGAGFHIGMAWTTLFNFLEAVVDTCNDLGRASDDTNEFIKGETTAIVNSSRIESALNTPPIKQLSKLPEGMGKNIASIVETWKQRDEEAKRRCSILTTQSSSNNVTIADGNRTDSSITLCAYAWMVGKGTGVNVVEELRQRIQPVLYSSDGWEIAGRPVQNPRTGWYARRTNATFEIRVPATDAPMHFLTIMSMKSYGPDWIGSKLNVEVTIQSPFENANTTAAAAVQPPDDAATASYEIDGYHEIKTSVHFPHKFKLPGNGARIGDVVILKAKLVGGVTFKINGIALCRF